MKEIAESAVNEIAYTLVSCALLIVSVICFVTLHYGWGVFFTFLLFVNVPSNGAGRLRVNGKKLF